VSSSSSSRTPTSREEGDWRGFTWQESGELAESVGRASGGRDWRENATAPSASAKWRLVYELLWYLENEENLAVVHALDSDNVLTYRLLDETVRAVETLLERAAQNAGALVPSGDMGEDAPTLWQQFATPSDSWLRRLGDFAYAPEVRMSRSPWNFVTAVL
jgi:hypothetical protein